MRKTALPDLGGLPLGLSVVLFLAAGLVIVASGTRLAGVADILADQPIARVAIR